MWEHHMQWHGWEHHMFGWWGVVSLMVLALLIAAVVAVLARSDSSRSPQTASGPAGDEAMEVLRRRYAEGQIDREEFERKRGELEQ